MVWPEISLAAGQGSRRTGRTAGGRERGRKGGADEQQVFGVAVSPLWHVARKLCVIYRQIVLRREVFVAKK